MTNTYYRKRSRRLQSSFQRVLSWLRRFLRARHRPISPRFLLVSTLGLLLVGILCTQIIYRQVQISRVKHEVNRLKKQNHKLRLAINRREVKVARLESLERIEKIAITQLGMVSEKSVPVKKVEIGQWAQLSPEGGRSP